MKKTLTMIAVAAALLVPSLASASMEQGRRAMRKALDLPMPEHVDLIPTGIYTLPEIASVGQSEHDARQAGVDVVTGRANFAELARGQISGSQDGLLKLVADAATRRVLGCQIIGEGATELVHLAQMAMMTGCEPDVFVEKIFNFPTLAEAYRVAALDLIGKLAARAGAAPPR